MRFGWLFAPSITSVMFALRTTVASLLALAIALWMELGEPQWAAMTVWIVAQNSRGESISKGRWRLVGTMIGMVMAIVLMAAFPQYPWLFLPALAIWVGLCAGLATLTHNFRGYALVLAGYTCTIIALGAVKEPDHVFNVAMARGTYIFLGVICETAMGMIALPNVAGRAREELRKRLQGILTRAIPALTSVLRQQPGARDDLSTLLGSLQASSDQIEFSRIEIRSEGNEVEHAYVTLGLVARVLSRGLGLRTRMTSVTHQPEALRPFLEEMATALDGLPERLLTDRRGIAALVQTEALLAECRGRMQTILPCDDEDSLNEGIILTGVEVMLSDLCETLRSYRASVDGAPVSERHRLTRNPDWRASMRNGVRTTVALLFGAYVWEVTAWPQGSVFLTFIAVVCARFATFENTVLLSAAFFYGAVFAALASVIPVFVVMPVTANYPFFCLVAGFFMLLGGLASRNPPTAVMAASYGTFFPFLLGMDNQGRINELSWFNTTIALLLGLGAGVVIFRAVLPFTPARAGEVLRYQLKRSLRRLALPGVVMDEYVWINEGTQSMERAVRFAGSLSSERAEAMLRGTLSVLTVGRNVLMLRKLAEHGSLPDTAVTAVDGLVRNLLRRKLPLTHTTATIDPTLDELYALERQSQDPSIRHDLVLAIGSLLIVRTEMPVSRAFLRGAF
ncbi:FUSC family protein [Gluconobacter sphaericus]|uniref:FUSC family protein n=1 Tax=Gluconobacter sphaericus TaxID=574987 RepID=UPI001B8D6A37|nr:FUSC family protein [Gluconobacter sphaericus]MBS1084771.1 FUSC family protein [Gluconobacter sphaericus]MBS1099584.1 FUSC family protein [Gluconobacter sphaericus]